MAKTPNEPTPLPSYVDMMEYVLDIGRECDCCKCGDWCTGIICGPNGPIFPACSSKDFSELLIQERVEELYKEDHADD